jgi:hypothetical protein
MEIQLEFWIVGVGLGPLLHIWKVVYLLFTPENLGKPSKNTHTQRREREMTPTSGSREWETLHPWTHSNGFGSSANLLPPIDSGLSNPNLLSYTSSSSISFKADHLTYIKTKCLHSYFSQTIGSPLYMIIITRAPRWSSPCWTVQRKI